MKSHTDLLDNLLSRTRAVAADQRLSLRDLAARTGIPLGTLKHALYGTVRDPRWSVVARLLEFVDSPSRH